MTIPFNPLIPEASQKPSLGKRLVTVLVVGFLLIAAIGFAIWGQHLNPPSSSARAPALAVSKEDAGEIARDLEGLQALAADTTAPAVRSSSPTADAPTIVAENDTMSVATSDKDRSFTFNRGDTASERFGKDAKKFCEYNQIADCNRVKADVEYKLPEGVTPRVSKLTKHEPLKATARHATGPTKPVTKPTTPKTNDAGEILYRRVGVAPLQNCGKRDILSVAEEAWEVLGLSQEDRTYLRGKIDTKNGPRLNLTEAEGRFDIPTGMRLEQVTFCRQGKVVKLGPMRTDWDEKQQALGPVKGERFQLPSGQTVVWMRNCFNWVLVDIPPPQEEEPPAPPAPPASAPPPDVPASAPPARDEPLDPPPAQPPSDQEEEEEVVWNYDRDLTVYAGGDRDVRFAGAEGAFYPALFYYSWGRYAIGIGGFGNFWEGATPDDYHFGGRYGALGLAQKLSTWDGRDWGLKLPMIGAFAEHGHNKSGFYREEREAKLWCAALSYNDATREKRGETKLPEWQLWASYCDPFSQTKSRTVFGQSVDSSSMSDIRYILGVGGRVFLSKDLTDVFGKNGIAAKLQPFLELGFNKTAPNPFSAHFYGGLRTVNKVVGCGFGVHYSEAGTIPGATCTYDVGRHLWLHDKEERWAEMVKSLEALGVAVDD